MKAVWIVVTLAALLPWQAGAFQGARTLAIINKHPSLLLPPTVSPSLLSPQDPLSSHNARLYLDMHTYLTSINRNDWDGDDVRWWSKIKRRFSRSFIDTGVKAQPVRTLLLLVHLTFFVAQVADTTLHIRKKYPIYWPKKAPAMIWDALWGSATPGPLTANLYHSVIRSTLQPYRYLTAGLIHGGILHFVLNMDALLRLPAWLETGLGSGLFFTCYAMSMIAGNMSHTLATYELSPRAGVIGASGAICGMYGLMLSILLKVGNRRAARQVWRGLLLLFVYGMFVPSISNAAHVGGVAGGLLVGFLSGPSFAKSYAARRKNSLEIDNLPRDYRLVLGFDAKPSDGLVPLPLLWLCLLAGLYLYQPTRGSLRHLKKLYEFA
jgi:membrane associated rhomboid family serine protease